MTEMQVLWSINTGLITMIGVAVKAWVTKIDKKLDERVEITHCNEHRADLKSKCEMLFRHKHAPTNGSKGEVIIP